MNIDLSFESHYSIEILHELSSGERFYYPNGTTNGGKDGVMVEIISSEGNIWTGIFAFGEISTKGILGIYAMPAPDKICVVSKGAGYIVSSKNPTNWEEIRPIPILGVYPVKSQDIIIFSSYTELVAYDKSGVKWRTERLAYDSFKVIEVTEAYLKGEYWDIQYETNKNFEVDLSTGAQVGGIRNF
ncbi:hypothetical protein EYV94_27855 [Puteibacter caeruleilacunae]|nr:hypothetical protein EYV94_27855 [Puteibacter caeruleilacunae]